MADTKITALAAITTVDPAADVLPIVDISDTSMAASGTTKKITSNQILGAGGTATLASATITGDLTVDTSTLKVDSANNRVGIVTATPLYPLDVNGNARIGTDGLGFGRLTVTKTTSGATLNLSLVATSGYSELLFTNYNDNTGASGWASYIRSNTNAGSNYASDLVFGTSAASTGSPVERYKLASDGVATWSNVGGVAGTAMTLNSTGLGVGVTPSASGGCLQLKSGITFPATQVASSDANTLDDYEEGTWTPTVGDASSGGNQATTATAVGRYTKVGRLVTVQFELTDINTTGLTAGNSLYIRGLPFTASSATTQFGTITGVGITFSGFLTCGVFNSTAFPIYQTSSGGSLADIKVSGFASGTADIWGTLTYIV